MHVELLLKRNDLNYFPVTIGSKVYMYHLQLQWRQSGNWGLNEHSAPEIVNATLWLCLAASISTQYVVSKVMFDTYVTEYMLTIKSP